jgi:hypothetical protein
LGVYKVQDITNEEFDANAVQVEMQCHHLYTTHHTTRAANIVVTYRIQHMIVDNDMV